MTWYTRSRLLDEKGKALSHISLNDLTSNSHSQNVLRAAEKMTPGSLRTVVSHLTFHLATLKEIKL